MCTYQDKSDSIFHISSSFLLPLSSTNDLNMARDTPTIRARMAETGICDTMCVMLPSAFLPHAWGRLCYMFEHPCLAASPLAMSQ